MKGEISRRRFIQSSLAGAASVTSSGITSGGPANAQAQDPAVVWADVDVNGSTKSDEYFYESLYSGILDHKERHLKFRQPSAYTVLTEKHPPLESQYPLGGVADTPEEVEKVYAKHKEVRQKGWRGEQVPYHWRW